MDLYFIFRRSTLRLLNFGISSIGYKYSMPYVYPCCQIFKAQRLSFPALALFQYWSRSCTICNNSYHTQTSIGDLTATLPPNDGTLKFVRWSGVPHSLLMFSLELVENCDNCWIVATLGNRLRIAIILDCL